MTLFATVELAPRDPILGLTEQFNADTNPVKVNLGVGVYQDQNGKLPLLACVKAAEAQLTDAAKPRGYLPIDGIAAYDRAVQQLVFGADSALLQAGRVATVQAVGGTGGLKVGADFLKKLRPNAKVLISDPSWENHRALFTNAGFKVESYAYYDAQNRGVDVAAMLADLSAAAPGSIVVLHACCHNPTGYDISPAQWQQVIDVCHVRELVPFLDMAYQGFGDGITEDGSVVKQFADAGLDFLVSTSFSKSFSLYGERVGALNVVCASREEAQRVLSQLKISIRVNYSSPPTHGAQVVTMVLEDVALRAQWGLPPLTLSSDVQAMASDTRLPLEQAARQTGAQATSTQRVALQSTPAPAAAAAAVRAADEMASAPQWMLRDVGLDRYVSAHRKMPLAAEMPGRAEPMVQLVRAEK